MIRVAVDALGGDRAPEEVVAGALEAAADSIQPILFGPAALDTQGIKHAYYESEGTAHEWQTWRRSFHGFAPLLFQDTARAATFKTSGTECSSAPARRRTSG